MAEDLRKRGHWIDAAWRRVLSECTEDAIDFFLPELSRDRDRSRELELIQDELPAIDSDSDKGGRIADVCFSVPIKNGPPCKVGCVVEQQHEDDKGFARRMFRGFYRLSDHLNDDVTALAIFTGDSKDRDEYKYSRYGVNLSFSYNSFHVMSQDIERLKQDGRAFAPVVLAARMMMAAKGEPQYREKYAGELLKIMRERDYDNAKKIAVLRFIGRILRMQDKDISSELKGEFLMQAIPISEYRKQLAIEDAKEEKAMEVASKMLSKGVSVELIKEFTGIDEEDIIALG